MLDEHMDENYEPTTQEIEARRDARVRDKGS